MVKVISNKIFIIIIILVILLSGFLFINNQNSLKSESMDTERTLENNQKQMDNNVYDSHKSGFETATFALG